MLGTRLARARAGLIVAGGLLVLMVVGVVLATILIRTSQDIRQQAYSGSSPIPAKPVTLPKPVSGGSTTPTTTAKPTTPPKVTTPSPVAKVITPVVPSQSTVISTPTPSNAVGGTTTQPKPVTTIAGAPPSTPTPVAVPTKQDTPTKSDTLTEVPSKITSGTSEPVKTNSLPQTSKEGALPTVTSTPAVVDKTIADSAKDQGKSTLPLSDTKIITSAKPIVSASPSTSPTFSATGNETPQAKDVVRVTTATCSAGTVCTLSGKNTGYCDTQGQCQRYKGLGSACVGNYQCQSGVCSGNICRTNGVEVASQIATTQTLPADTPFSSSIDAACRSDLDCSQGLVCVFRAEMRQQVCSYRTLGEGQNCTAGTCICKIGTNSKFITPPQQCSAQLFPQTPRIQGGERCTAASCICVNSVLSRDQICPANALDAAVLAEVNPMIANQGAQATAQELADVLNGTNTSPIATYVKNCYGGLDADCLGSSVAGGAIAAGAVAVVIAPGALPVVADTVNTVTTAGYVQASVTAHFVSANVIAPAAGVIGGTYVVQTVAQHVENISSIQIPVVNTTVGAVGGRLFDVASNILGAYSAGLSQWQLGLPIHLNLAASDMLDNFLPTNNAIVSYGNNGGVISVDEALYGNFSTLSGVNDLMHTNQRENPGVQDFARDPVNATAQWFYCLNSGAC